VTLSQIKSEQNPAYNSRVERYWMEREKKSQTASLCLYEILILHAIHTEDIKEREMFINILQVVSTVLSHSCSPASRLAWLRQLPMVLNILNDRIYSLTNKAELYGYICFIIAMDKCKLKDQPNNYDYKRISASVLYSSVSLAMPGVQLLWVFMVSLLYRYKVLNHERLRAGALEFDSRYC
jgi:hypothetical protein